MNGVTLPIVTRGTIRPEDSGAARNATGVSALNYTVKTQVSGRLSMSGVRSPRHAQNPLSGERAKENALNNPPCPITPTLTPSSVHHSSHQLTVQRFYRLKCHLKDHMCRKVT